MKTIFKANLTIIFLLLSMLANGQGKINHFYYNYLPNEKPVEFGARMGFNISSLSKLDSGNKSTKFGFMGGVTLDFNLSHTFYLSTALDFINKGTKADLDFNYSGTELFIKDSRIHAMYLQVPIHAGYKIWVGNKAKISLHAGPYVAYGIDGMTKLGDNVTKVQGSETLTLTEFIQIYSGFKREWETFGEKAPNDVNVDTYNRFDWGIGLGIAYQYDRVVLGVNYDLGLNDISKAKNKTKNNAGYATIGYKF